MTQPTPPTCELDAASCACDHCPVHANQPEPPRPCVLIIPAETLRPGAMSCPKCHEFLNDLPTSGLAVVFEDRPLCESCADRMIERAINDNDDGALDVVMRMLAPTIRFLNEKRHLHDPLARFARDAAELVSKRSKEREATKI